MTSIDTSTVGQVEARTSRGAGKAKSDGEAKGQFSETFDSVATRGRDPASPGRKSLADAGIEQDHTAAHSLKGQAADGEGDGATTVSLLQRIPAELLDRTRAPSTEADPEAAVPGNGTVPAEAGQLPAAPDVIAAPADGDVDGAGSVDGADGDESDDGDAGDGLDSLISLLTGEPAGQPATGTPPEVVAAAGGQAQAGQGGRTGQVAGGGDAAEAVPGMPGGRAGAAAALPAGVSQDGTEAGAPAADTAGDDADQIFRLVRSDGKATSVDITVGGKGEVTATSDQVRLPGVETVAVLDSRRYLGLAQQGNITAVTAAIAQDPAWAAALAEQTDSAPDVTGKVVNTLKIQLQPIDLGTVTASLRLQGETLVVDLKVETGKAFRHLSDDQDAIVKALRGHGFSIDQVNVQMAPSSDRGGSATGQGDSQAQFAGQQQAREGGSGRQQGGEPRQAAQTAFNEGPAHEYGQVDSLTSNDQRRPSGGVFL